MISANISNSKRKAVYRRDGYRCALCDYSQHLQLHHVVPRGEGGPDSEQNLITLCAECHALAHGFDLRGLDDPPTQEDMTQACVEYLADYYAPDWNPWGKEGP